MNDNTGFGFVIGVIFALLISISFDVNKDISYENKSKQMERMLMLCEKLDSYPRSFDMSVLTCKNGVSIKYKDYNEEE